MKTLIPFGRIEHHIYFIRDQKVMLDRDLAELYGVSTKALNQAVKRNWKRFPADFMFRLSREEDDLLRSQFVTSRQEHGGPRYLPFVFTEHGAIMIAAVLHTSIAIDASIHIARAFNKLRELLATHKELAKKLEELEQKYDKQFKVVFDVIRKLMKGPSPKPLTVKGFRKD
jgi:hypothetical protein